MLNRAVDVPFIGATNRHSAGQKGNAPPLETMHWVSERSSEQSSPESQWMRSGDVHDLLRAPRSGPAWFMGYTKASSWRLCNPARSLILSTVPLPHSTHIPLVGAPRARAACSNGPWEGQLPQRPLRPLLSIGGGVHSPVLVGLPLGSRQAFLRRFPDAWRARVRPLRQRTSMSSIINRDIFAPQTEGENKISQLKEDVERLQRSLESLNENEIKHDAERRIEGKLNDLEKSLHDSDAAHQQQQADVDALLKRILEKEVMASLEHLVAAGVLEHIDDLVKKEVAELLPTHLDANVHKKIKEHREELERLEHELNNAESMRANSALRADQGDMHVHPLYNSEGRISEHFPKTLNDLIFMPDVIAARLRQEYEPGVKVSGSSRENNINAVLRLFGIGMQLVWRRTSSS